MRWDLLTQWREASDDGISTKSQLLAWHTPASGLAHVVEFHTPETTRGLPDQDTLRLRLMCHFLLDALPSEGLEEVSEAIRDTYVFYLERTPSTFSLPARQTAKAGVIRSYERPVFSLAEEDE